MKPFNYVNTFSFYLFVCLLLLFTNAANCQTVLDTVYVADKKILSPEEEWRLKAIEDMSNGNYYLLVFGMAIHMVDLWERIKLTRKYGFTFKYEGCVYPAGGNSYNKEVMKQLDSMNGKGWYDKYLKEFKALEDSVFQSLNKNK